MSGCHCWWDEHCGRCSCCPTRLDKLTDQLLAKFGWDEADYRRDGDQALTALADSIGRYDRQETGE